MTYERNIFHSDDKFLGTDYDAFFPTYMKYLPRVSDNVIFVSMENEVIDANLASSVMWTIQDMNTH